MSILRTTAIATILIGAAVFLNVAINRDSASENESLSEFSATEISATRIGSPDVELAVPAQQAANDDAQEPVDSPALEPGRAMEAPDGALSSFLPPPPDVSPEAQAALSGVIELIRSSPSGEFRLESEPVDPNWAPQMESTIWSVASVAGEIRDVQCRTTYCRAVLSPLEFEAVEGIPNHQQLVPNQRILTDVFEAIIRNSNGRLTGFGFSRPPPFNEQQSDAEIVVTLSGRPIENSGSVQP